MSRYADGTQDAMAPASKKSPMVGSAVATITESKVDTNMHSESPAKTAMTFLNGKRFVWSVSVTGSVASDFNNWFCSVSSVLVVSVRWLVNVTADPSLAGVATGLSSESTRPSSPEDREMVFLDIAAAGYRSRSCQQ